jgi:hypothetical protein
VVATSVTVMVESASQRSSALAFVLKRGDLAERARQFAHDGDGFRAIVEGKLKCLAAAGEHGERVACAEKIGQMLVQRKRSPRARQRSRARRNR